MSLADQPGWHRGDWMQTFTGRQFYPLSPDPDDIDSIDVAHALSNLCRYAGHVDRFYSVAEHCVLMSRAVAPEFALEALLHDATEAYVVDVPRPLKINLPDYQAAERGVQEAVWIKYDLPMVNPIPTDGSKRRWHPVEADEVKDADTRILLDERAALMTRTRHPWGIDSLEPLGVLIRAWSPKDAENAYLNRLTELGAL